MLRFLLLIVVLLLGAPNAYAQGGAVTNTTLTGAAIGSGYNLTNFPLYIPTSGSLAAVVRPFSVSFDALTPSYSSNTGNIFIRTDQLTGTTNQGFVVDMNSATANDSAARVQALVRPAFPGVCDVNNTGGVCARGVPFPATGPLVDNIRHNYCVVFSTTSQTMYIDGILQDQNPNLGTFTAGANTWRIGSGFPTTVGSAPTLYDMRVYSKALTADQCVNISRLNQANLIPNSGTLNADLILSLPLNNCITTGPLVTCPDGSGHSNDATNDKAPPVVVITPTLSGTKTGSINVSATCTDPAGPACTQVCYMIDGGAFSLTCPTTAPNFTYSLDTTKLVDGSHVITAIGYNFTGVTGTSAGNTITTSNSVSATNYYFCSSTCNSNVPSDSNNCTTTATPCQTIAKLATLALKGGDTVNLFHDQTFSITAAGLTLCAGNSGCGAQNYFPSSGTLTFTTFGGGSCNPISGSATGCATLSAVGGSTAVYGIRGINAPNVSISNLAIIGNVASLTTRGLSNGIEFDSNFPSNSMAGPTINNNLIKDFSYEIEFNNFNFAYLGGISNFSITDNFLTNTTHVVNGRTFPTNPSALAGMDFRGNANGTIQGNLITYMGGHSGDNGNGIAFLNYPNVLNESTLMQFNVVHDFGANCMNVGGGPAGFEFFSLTNLTLQFNEAYNGLPSSYPTLIGIDYDGFDIDDGTSHSIMQYNYAHDNPVSAGINLINNPIGTFLWDFNIARYNIAENNAENIQMSGPAFAPNSYVYNNTVSGGGISNGQPTNQGPQCPGGALIANLINNLCITTFNGTPSAEQIHLFDIVFIMSAGFNTPPLGLLRTNDYWQAGTFQGGDFRTTQFWPHTPGFCSTAPYCLGTNSPAITDVQILWTGQEIGSLQVDPKITGTASTGGTCYTSGTPAGPQPCPAGYQLQSGSPVIGVGTDLTQAPYSLNVGTVDYYGNLLSSNTTGTHFNIGADGAPH